jgi:OmpA-OmpF porin, OOP family
MLRPVASPFPVATRICVLALLTSTLGACGSPPTAPAASPAPVVASPQPVVEVEAAPPIADREPTPAARAFGSGPVSDTEAPDVPAEPTPDVALDASGAVGPVGGTAAPPPPPPLPPPPQQRPPAADLLVLSGPLAFETGRVSLRPESDPVLLGVVRQLRAKPAITLLRIEVHSDSAGGAASNQLLTEQRALTVARWLVARGVRCRRLLPVGFGETKPIADNRTAAGRALNRRTELHVAALNGRPLNGRAVDGGGRVAGDPCVP